MNRRVLASLVLAALLTGIGTVGVLQAEQARTSPSARNLAHVDVDATLEVRSAVTRAVNKILTYHHDDVEATAHAAEGLLRGAAREEYRRLFTHVSGHAPKQRLSVLTRVVDTAVLSLTKNRAEVLVFTEQTATRDDGELTYAAAQLVVTVERHDDRWLVTDLTQL